MITQSAALALGDILSQPFRAVLVKSVALTLALLAALWTALAWLVGSWFALPYPWLDAGFSVVAGIALVLGLGFLVAPATALFAGLFLDDVAEAVERAHYPAEKPGRAMPLAQSLLTTIKFFGVILAVNAVALPLVVFLGFGFLIFLVANAYLLGREYFELAALRFRDGHSARALRTRNSGTVFAAGLLIAVFLLVPFVNILTPLFATALMVHLQKRLSGREPRRDERVP